jgi:putative endonuclease
MARGKKSDPPRTPAAPAPERQVAFKFGISAESRAAAFLIAKGFRILARRWR